MADSKTVLIIDDEPDIRELLAMTLSRMDLENQAAGSVSAAQDLLSKQHFDLCLTDMRLPDGSGIDLVRYIQEHHPEMPVAVITAYGNMESAVEALKAGAFDFVSKPVQLENFRDLVSVALRLSDTQGKARRSRDVLLGDSQSMRDIRGMIVKLARSQAPVFVHGESGTGKELVARLIHEKSPRSEHAFTAINCGAIPSELMESEFFGHKKGSFTGAIADKPGLFQAAQNGTLFLDEVAELPKEMQIKLLRAIQEKAVRPVGDQKEIPVNVRILSASHMDLGKLVEEERFRRDLYYRINVIELLVPALRDRIDDIPDLTHHFLNRLNLKTQCQVSIAEDAQHRLKQYGFPGNVRELENILERALALCDGETITANDLLLPDNNRRNNPQTQYVPGTMPLEEHLELIERQAFIDALTQTGNNKTAAAELLGLSFRSFRYKLAKYGL